MADNTNTASSADTSSVTAIKVKVVLDTTTEELKNQFKGVQNSFKKAPVEIAFGVNEGATIGNVNAALKRIIKKVESPKLTLKIDESNIDAAVKKAVNKAQSGAKNAKTEVKVNLNTDAENAGIATDGMADSVSELRSELKQLAGVDIMKDNNTFKSTYQIMKELSEVWKNLSDTTQANITELISGKRGGQSTSALLNNFSVAEDAMKQALNSSGSAMRENQTYMDSLQAKLNQLDSAFQKFSTDLMKSDIPKFFVSLATVFVDGADSAVKFAGALPTLTAAISGVLSVMQMSGKLKNGAGKVNMPSYICCV